MSAVAIPSSAFPRQGDAGARDPLRVDEAAERSARRAWSLLVATVLTIGFPDPRLGGDLVALGPPEP